MSRTARSTRSTRKPQRRGGTSRTRQRKRAPAPGVLDRAVAALPFSEAATRRLITVAILALVGAALLAIAIWTGLAGAAGVAMAEAAGRAGFRVERIQVTGLDRMERMAVYEVALDQQSRAMPLVDLAKVRERLVAYPWIADARVSRRLPDTLVIQIIEREPSAVWQHRGRLTLIDGEGRPLEPVAVDRMPNLPLVVGPRADRQQAGYRSLVAAAPELAPMIKAATWIGNRRWDLTFETGERLSLPEGEEEARRALVRFAELDDTQRLLGRGYVRFDMRDPSRLVLRMPGEETRAITGEPTS